jgi:hypothetical protein
MWQILFDLLPHLTRLVPMADRFFATRTASEKANEAALAALATTVRADLTQLGDTHAGLSQQLADQTAILTATAQDAARARIAIQSVEVRISSLERRANVAMRLLAVVLMLLSATLLLLATILLNLSHR